VKFRPKEKFEIQKVSDFWWVSNSRNEWRKEHQISSVFGFQCSAINIEG
jgi:hypothetical protein